VSGKSFKCGVCPYFGPYSLTTFIAHGPIVETFQVGQKIVHGRNLKS
jgi:hypothetical protein